MKLDIQPFSPAHTDDVVELWQEIDLIRPWNDPVKDIQRKMDEDPNTFYIGLIDGEVVASCMAGYDGHRGWIYYLAVKVKYQKRGFAKALIIHAENELKKLGCPKIELMVREDNTDVIRFYKRLDYKDDPVIVLSKRLIED